MIYVRTLEIKSCASGEMRNSSIFRLSYRDAFMLAYNSFRSIPSGAANASSPVGGGWLRFYFELIRKCFNCGQVRIFILGNNDWIMR